jgi:hypothetical protein
MAQKAKSATSADHLAYLGHRAACLRNRMERPAQEDEGQDDSPRGTQFHGPFPLNASTGERVVPGSQHYRNTEAYPYVAVHVTVHYPLS